MEYDRADSRVEQMAEDPGAYFKKVRARVVANTEAVAAGSRPGGVIRTNTGPALVIDVQPPKRRMSMAHTEGIAAFKRLPILARSLHSLVSSLLRTFFNHR